ncbi:DNA excision repair protein ERCC-1 [Diabrotica virgifera virgifera]|uniref:ERCC1-like central domain-containing protein n=1 Tax=Diabrotica virgifera virgifera TaxID=50390 RepID=A0ABM5KHM0_DIAVI|nr:DNA excision repair protein ERCC-1 [Diabrotica virgifera virgifera]
MDDSLQNIASEFETDFFGDEQIASTSTEASSTDKSKGSSKTHCILVNPKQRGNPLLKAIHNVPWEYGDIIPDYEMGSTTCALFLSIRYHNLNPDYIHDRLKKLGQAYQLRVLLVQIDVKDPHHVLKNLTRICILADLTLILAWSSEEAGKIIETYKIYENKPADYIKEKGESSPYLRLIQVLTTIRTVNKSDAMALIDKFKTLDGILQASELQLAEIPGFGLRKASKLYTTLHSKFCR